MMLRLRAYSTQIKQLVIKFYIEMILIGLDYAYHKFLILSLSNMHHQTLISFISNRPLTKSFSLHLYAHYV